MIFQLSDPFLSIIQRQQPGGITHKGSWGTPNPLGPAKETLSRVQVSHECLLPPTWRHQNPSANAFHSTPLPLKETIPRNSSGVPFTSPLALPSPLVPSLPPVLVSSQNTPPTQPLQAKKSHPGVLNALDSHETRLSAGFFPYKKKTTHTGPSPPHPPLDSYHSWGSHPPPRHGAQAGSQA